MPAEAGAGHTDAAQLDDHVGSGRGGGYALAPLVEHLVVAPGVGTFPYQPADVVQDDGQIGHGLGELRQLRHLGEEHPAFQRQPHVGQHAGAGAEVVAAHLALRLVGRRVLHLGARVPGHRVADAPEAVGAGRLQRLQHRAHVLAQVQVGVADNGCRRLAGAVQSVIAGRGQALHELHLAHRTHFLRAAGPVH